MTMTMRTSMLKRMAEQEKVVPNGNYLSSALIRMAGSCTAINQNYDGNNPSGNSSGLDQFMPRYK